MTDTDRVSYLLVCHSYPPVLGGSEVEAQRVSEELQKRGHQPLIVCAGGPPMPDLREWVDPRGLKVRIYGKGSVRKRDLFYALGVAWSLFRERNNYEVAYFLMQGLHLVTGLPVARMLGKPIVMKFSCSGIVTRMKTTWFGRLELVLLRWWAKHILLLNPGMVDEALEAGFERSRLGWMPNPVDINEFRPPRPGEREQMRKKLGIEEDTPLVVYVGRLVPQKEIPWLLGSFARVVKERPRARLALVGDGPLRAEMVALADKLNVKQNVIFTGRLSAPEVLEWLHAGDAFTLVSKVEGLPCSLIEAMAAGITPVVSNIPAHAQIIDHDQNGLLTDLGNEESIAQGYIRVLDDAALRARLGAAAREHMVKQFSTPRVADRYEDLFADCVGASR